MGVDLTGYTDIRLAEEDPNVIIGQAITALRAAFPGYEPREGTTEMALLEQDAVMTAELGYAVNLVPAQTTEAALYLYGLTRNPGTYAVTAAQFSVTTSATDVTIPAGTVFAVPTPDGDSALFVTTADLLIPAASSTGVADARASELGDAANGVAAGTIGSMVSPVAFVDTVRLAAVVTGGTNAEDQRAFLNRGAVRFTRLVQTLVRPEHFTAAALETVGVTRAYTLDRYNSDGPSSAPVNGVGTDPGHVTVAVAGASGAPLSNVDLDALRASLQAQAFVLLTVHAINANLVTVNVTSSVVALPGYTQAEVQANVAVALDAYLNPDTWPWAGTVYRNELISLIDGVVGVDRVVSIDVPASDLVLTGVAPLPVLGTATTTVTTS